MASESAHARLRGGEEVVSDPISNLLDPILTTILSLMPLVDAVRTSILSKRWRYLWTSIPHLDLYKLLTTYRPEVPPHQRVDKYVSIFYLIFNFRRAPIFSCSLPVFSFNFECPFHMDNFLLLLHKLHTQELVLKNVGRSDNTLSPKLCYFQSLKSLEIVDLSVVLPSQFKDLTNLQTLSLYRVRITNSQLEILVSHCPNLGDLYLSDCMDVCDLRIRAPNLRSLNITLNKPMCLSLIIAPCLNRVFLNYSSAGGEAGEQQDDHGEKAEAVNLVKSLMNLSHIKCFRFICDAKLFKLPYNLPTGHQFVHLKELSMILDFHDAEMVSLLLFLLRSCPNLQELALEGTCLNEHIPIEIDFWEKQRPPDCFINPLLRAIRLEKGFPITIDFWEKHKPPECLINVLMMIYVFGISLSCIGVVEFMKFLLLNARVLIVMILKYIITPRGQMEEEVIVNDLLHFKRLKELLQKFSWK